MLLRPPSLQQGDSVYILSTARKVSLPEIQFALDTFKSWGLNVLIGKTIGAEHHQFAGDDKLRTEDFQYALNNPDIKAIICARGGYGTVRMMDELDYTQFTRNPKWICGFSDITYLHTHITNTLGIQTMHSSMPFALDKKTPDAIETMRSELFGTKCNFTIDTHSLNKIGLCEGPLIGGNLSILYSITGTKSGINTFGKILFLEDLDEYLYHIDRMLMNLKRSGKLHDLAGLVVGGFTDMHDNETSFGKDAYGIIAEHVSEFSYPVCFNFPAGHIADNRALVVGRKYTLKVDSVASYLC